MMNRVFWAMVLGIAIVGFAGCAGSKVTMPDKTVKAPEVAKKQPLQQEK